MVELLLFIERGAEIDPRQPEVRGQIDGAAKESLGIVVELLAGAVHAHQAQRIEVLGLPPQDAPQDLLRLRRLALAIELHGFNDGGAIRIVLQRPLEGFVRFAAVAGQREHFNELAIGRIRCRVVPDGGPQRFGRFVELALLQQRVGKILVGQREVGHQPDYLGQHPLRFGVAALPCERHPEQAQQVGIVGRVLQRGFEHRACRIKVVGLHQAHGLLEREPCRRLRRIGLQPAFCFSV